MDQTHSLIRTSQVFLSPRYVPSLDCFESMFTKATNAWDSLGMCFSNAKKAEFGGGGGCPLSWLALEDSQVLWANLFQGSQALTLRESGLSCFQGHF